MNGNANANLYSDVFAADLEAELTHCEITSHISSPGSRPSEELAYPLEEDVIISRTSPTSSTNPLTEDSEPALDDKFDAGVVLASLLISLESTVSF